MWPLGIAEVVCFLLHICVKAPKSPACSDASEMGERTIFTAQAWALCNQSFAGKPPRPQKIKEDSFPLAPHLSVISTPVSLTHRPETAAPCHVKQSTGHPPTKLCHHQWFCLQDLSNVLTDSLNPLRLDYS